MLWWVEHFEQLFHRPKLSDPPDILLAEMDQPIDCSKPARKKIWKSIKQLSNSKAVAPDSIQIQISVPIFTFSLLFCAWQDYEAIHGAEEELNPGNVLNTA